MLILRLIWDYIIYKFRNWQVLKKMSIFIKKYILKMYPPHNLIQVILICLRLVKISHVLTLKIKSTQIKRKKMERKNIIRIILTKDRSILIIRNIKIKIKIINQIKTRTIVNGQIPTGQRIGKINGKRRKVNGEIL